MNKKEFELSKTEKGSDYKHAVLEIIYPALSGSQDNEDFKELYKLLEIHIKKRYCYVLNRDETADFIQNFMTHLWVKRKEFLSYDKNKIFQNVIRSIKNKYLDGLKEQSIPKNIITVNIEESENLFKHEVCNEDLLDGIDDIKAYIFQHPAIKEEKKKKLIKLIQIIQEDECLNIIDLENKFNLKKSTMYALIEQLKDIMKEIPRLAYLERAISKSKYPKEDNLDGKQEEKEMQKGEL